MTFEENEAELRDLLRRLSVAITAGDREQAVRLSAKMIKVSAGRKTEMTEEELVTKINDGYDAARREAAFAAPKCSADKLPMADLSNCFRCCGCGVIRLWGTEEYRFIARDSANRRVIQPLCYDCFGILQANCPADRREHL